MPEEPKKGVTINYNYLIAIALSLIIGWLAKQGVTPAPLPPIPPELIAGMVENQKKTAEILLEVNRK